MDYVNENWDIIVYVLGNHEFYSNSKSMPCLLELYETKIGEKWPKINLLVNETMCIEWDNTTWVVIGSTAWGSADYSLVLSINDFKKIKSYNDHEHLKPITVKEYQTLHNSDMEYIMDEIVQGFPTIIVTHFPLTREGTSDPIYGNQSDAMKRYYANELHDKLKGNPNLTMVAGHTHYAYDFIMDDVRYIGNYGGL